MSRPPITDGRPARFNCGHEMTLENTSSARGCLTCRRAQNARYNATKRKLLPKRQWKAKDRCSGSGGVGCPCQYHDWRRQYRAAKRKRALKLVPQATAPPVTGPKYITTPAIQAIIESCRPAYLQAIAPKKPTGRPRRAA